jgi:DNA-binding transcriptional LysR family regulator
MVRKIDWHTQIGRRIKLRDLHVFSMVVERGSMAKAAAQLGVSQPAVSEIIADLEATLGVPLFDRNPRGVEPNIYGRTLLKRSVAVFDELKQGIRDIESIADPTAGEIHIGCAESIATSILVPLIQRFAQRYPRVVINVHRVLTSTLQVPELRQRSLDLVLARVVPPIGSGEGDLDVEVIFEDSLAIVAAEQNRLTRLRTIDLADLVDEPWILTPPESWGHMLMAQAFAARGVDMPKLHVMSFSIPLRIGLVAAGPYLTAVPASVVRRSIDRLPVKVLPVEMSGSQWPVVLVTLKNRTLSPVAQSFVDHVRAIAPTMSAELHARQMSA